MNRPYVLQFLRYAGAMAMLALLASAFPFTSCSDGGACDWLFAPASFVDAGQPGCMAEPAGERCDASTGRCQSLCPAGEYLLTCTKGEASRLAIPEEALQDPVVVVGRPIACTVLETGDDPARNRTAYCCRCER